MLPGLFVIPVIFWGKPEYMTQIIMLIVMIVPMLLWFGISIVVYIIARHHPNARAGHYTQLAAYRYYGIIGFIIVVGTFYGTEVFYWVVTWIICASILIPWTIIDLISIKRAEWTDTIISGESL